MEDEKVTILASELDRLLDIEKRVKAKEDIAAAWNEAIHGAIDDLLKERFSEELLEADITVEIKDERDGVKTFTTRGVANDDDVDYLIERIYQRHAEREAEILHYAGML